MTTALLTATAVAAPGTQKAAFAAADGAVGAFQADTGILWTVSAVGSLQPTGLAMRSSSSPSIKWFRTGTSHGVAVAFQANTGVLWTMAHGVARSTGLAMKHGTSPRGTAAPGDAIAFQGNDGTLWRYRDGVGWSTGLPMRPATSPDILPYGGGFWIAFQSDTGVLWVVSPAGVATSTGRLMRAGSSPTLSLDGTGKPHVAFQADTGQLWIADVNTGQGNPTGLAMMPGTNPGIHASRFLGFRIAVHLSTGQLWTGSASPGGHVVGSPTGRRMRAGTSPAQASVQLDTFLFDYPVAFQAETGELWLVDGAGEGTATGVVMMPNTSPSLGGHPFTV